MSLLSKLGLIVLVVGIFSYYVLVKKEIESYCYVGHLLRMQGKNQMAMLWYQSAIAKAEERVKISDILNGESGNGNGNDNRDWEDEIVLADALNYYGAMFQASGEIEEAIKVYKRVVSIREKIDSKDDLATALNNLGGGYELMGQYNKALSLYKRALSIYEESLGKHHNFVGTVCNNIGSIYSNKDNLQEALPWFQRAVEIKEIHQNESYGGIFNKFIGNLNRFEIGAPLYNLALTYHGLKRYDEALEIYNRLIQWKKSTFGIHHPSYGNSLVDIGIIQFDLKNYKEAKLLFNDAFDIFNVTLGSNHSNTNAVLQWIDSCELEEAKEEEEEEEEEDEEEMINS